MRRKSYYQFFVSACVLVYVYYFFGVGDYINSKSFEDDFDYPLNIDIRPLVEEVLAGKKSAVAPINFYPYRFLTNSGKCSTLEKLDLFIVVKSAMENFELRNAIRQTYGQENLIPGIIIRTLFFLGVNPLKSDTQKLIDKEMADFKDIIQMDFQDCYYNNTIKTMMSFRWLYEHCSTADYYFFTDDDMYVSVKNLLDYVQDVAPTVNSSGNREEYGTQSICYAGFMFNSTPHRIRSSKWRVSLEEYPWNKWPPYITAGAYVLSNRCMKVLYAGSLFVKNFRFDDIYLGIVAKKVGLKLTHCPNIYFYEKGYSLSGYKNVIASHGYDNPKRLIRVWKEQNAKPLYE